MGERDTCDNCGAEVDTLEVDGYEFVMSEDDARLCIDCQWEEYGGAVYADGGKGEEQVKERWG